MTEVLGVFILILSIGFLLGWLYARLRFSPIKKALGSIRDILLSGNLGLRIPVRTNKPEIQEVVGLINRMLEQNTNLAKQLSATFDNVAHDLKTPVTRLRATAEMALEKQDNVEICRDALADCLEESERVLQILDTLMDISEAETGGMRLKLGDFCLSELVDEVIEMYQEVAEERRVGIESRVPKHMQCRVDKVRFEQMLANLLDNAIKYNREGGSVIFDARKEDKGILISISDSGIGISSFEHEKIFDRLYRSDRSRAQKGLGLGLSCVKAIVEAHKGRVWAEGAINEGSTFFVLLPISTH